MKSFDKNNQQVNLIVGYNTNNGFIIQDESIYEQEQKYYKNLEKTFQF